MGDDLVKSAKSSRTIERGQYILTIGVIAALLFAVGIPFYVIFFLGAFTFFLWKIFAHNSTNEVRGIFEFYLRSSEILREDGRRWYGFEIQEAIDRGNKILISANAAPPLVQFALAALYRKNGDHSASLRHLEALFENGEDGESEIMLPTSALKEYVRILRKIERAPSEAPLTAAAVRSLERLRKNKGQKYLAEARELVSADVTLIESEPDRNGDDRQWPHQSEIEDRSGARSMFISNSPNQNVPANSEDASEHKFSTERQSISELLQDIYDDGSK